MAIKDMTGLRFGAWTVLRRDVEDTRPIAYWICQCDCGSPARPVSGPSLRCGSSTRCNACRKRQTPEERKAAANAASRAWQKRNPERAKQVRREWSRRHPDRIKAKNADHKRRHPDIWLARELKPYGISPDDFRRMLAEQGHACALCGGQPKRARLAVDHCHETGVVRGLLCERCNMALGLLDDDADRMRRAAEYIDRARPMKKTG